MSAEKDLCIIYASEYNEFNISANQTLFLTTLKFLGMLSGLTPEGAVKAYSDNNGEVPYSEEQLRNLCKKAPNYMDVMTWSEYQKLSIVEREGRNFSFCPISCLPYIWEFTFSK